MTSGPNLVQIIHASNSAPAYQNHAMLTRQTIIGMLTNLLKYTLIQQCYISLKYSSNPAINLSFIRSSTNAKYAKFLTDYKNQTTLEYLTETAVIGCCAPGRQQADWSSRYTGESGSSRATVAPECGESSYADRIA